jgi:hypothetical protein
MSVKTMSIRNLSVVSKRARAKSHLGFLSEDEVSLNFASKKQRENCSNFVLRSPSGNSRQHSMTDGVAKRVIDSAGMTSDLGMGALAQRVHSVP